MFDLSGQDFTSAPTGYAQGDDPLRAPVHYSAPGVDRGRAQIDPPARAHASAAGGSTMLLSVTNRGDESGCVGSRGSLAEAGPGYRGTPGDHDRRSQRVPIHSCRGLCTHRYPSPGARLQVYTRPMTRTNHPTPVTGSPLSPWVLLDTRNGSASHSSTAPEIRT